MKFYPNAHNLLAAAVVVALNPVPSTAIDRTVVTRAGGGIARATGGYNGQVAAVYDVEIRNDTISGTPRVSAPRFTGVGNSIISDVVADAGAVAQSITLTLADLGTETRSAYTPFQGKILRAKASGADANYIQITVDESAMVRTVTNAALLADVVAGTNDYVGDEWNFGGLPRNPDGTIPPTAARLSFGDDPAVYRQYKVFANGQYVYGFTPVPMRGVPRGAPVKAVTGGRTITVTHTLGAAAPAFVAAVAYTLGQRVKPITPNGHWYEVTIAGTAGAEPAWPTNGSTVTTSGVTFVDRGVHTNTYSSIVTLFDALTAINGDADSLITCDDAIVLDYNQGGMGITDLSVRTSAYVQGIVRDGSPNIRDSVFSVSVAATAPTEEIVIKCTQSGTANAEPWDVRGTVSGLLPFAVTGVPYSFGTLSFTIPLLEVPSIAPNTTWSTKFEPVERDPKPVACVRSFFLGALAQPRTFNFIAETRVTECTCDDATVTGGPDPIFLGVVPEGATLESLPPALKAKAQDLWLWEADFIEANTEIIAESAGPGLSIDTSIPLDGPTDYLLLYRSYSATIKADRIDIEFAKKVRSMFYNCLRQMFDHHDPDAIPSAATTLWDTAFAAMQVDLADLADFNIGSDFWKHAALTISQIGIGSGPVETSKQNVKLFTESFAIYLERYRARLDQVLIEADIEPSFDGSTTTGTGPWTDYNEPIWLVATDSNLLPIQPGHGYHSAIKVTDEDGNVTYVSTQEFFIGVNFGCGLQAGDRFSITIGETGTNVRGYQMGDNIQVRIASGSAVQLGGGQVGNDTQIWGVQSSVSGALPTYAQYKPTPALYSVAHPGEDLDFKITEGPVPGRLGDRYSIFIEGGQFRSRKNGGAWSADTAIAPTVALSDGVSVAFDEGIAPSFVAGDSYTFSAAAVNGGNNIASLTDGGIVTTQITEATIVKHRIECIVATAASATDCLILFQELTEVGATVTLRGYALDTDLEGTEIISVSALTNGSRELLIVNSIATACEKWTVTYYSTANTPTTLGWRWMFIGLPIELQLYNNRRVMGDVVNQWTLPRRSGRRSALGVRAEFSMSKQQSVQDFLYAIEQASINDAGRMAVVVRASVAPPVRARDAFDAAFAAYPEAGMVAFDRDAAFEIQDVMRYQSAASNSVLSFSLNLTPV